MIGGIRSRRNGYVLIFCAAALWALVGIFTQGALSEGVGALEIAFWRAFLSGAVFVVHAFFVGQLGLRSVGDGVKLTGFALIGVTAYFGSYLKAVEVGGISLAVVLLYTAPAFVAVLARIFLGEAITRPKILGVICVVAGVSLVAFGGSSEGVNVTGMSLTFGLIAGLSYVSYYIVGKRLLCNYTPVTIYAYILPVGALGLLPFVEFGEKTLLGWGYMALLAIFSTYLAYLIYFVGLKRVESSRAVLVASMEPVLAGCLAALFFGERLGVWGLVGAILVVMASMWAVVFRPRRRAELQGALNPPSR